MMLWVPTLLAGAQANPHVANGIWLGLLAVGILFQTVAELRARGGAEEEADEEPKAKAAKA
jgi:hypothetical protein